MAAQNPPYSMQTGAHGAELFRRAVGSVLNTAGGVVALGDLAVTANSPAAMNVLVASGSIWIPGTTNTAQGMYHCFNDASVTLSIAAASATNPRIDTIVAQVEDAAYAGATNAWKLAVVTGTATVGATLANLTGAGAVPASSLVLAYVLVAANATTIAAGAIQDNRIFSRPNLPMRSNPSGRIYASGTTSLTANINSTVTMAATNWTRGGITKSGNTLLVPVTGYYLCSAGVFVLATAGMTLGTMIYVDAALAAEAQSASSAGYVITNVSDVVYATAGQAISCSAVTSVNNTVLSGTAFTWLSASLVSI